MIIQSTARFLRAGWARLRQAQTAGAFCIGALALLAAPSLAHAQIDIPTFDIATNPQGINLATGRPTDTLVGVSIGDPRDGGLSYEPLVVGSGQVIGTLHGWVELESGGDYVVHLGKFSDRFSSSLVGAEGRGSSLTHPAANDFVYRDRDGTVVTFGSPTGAPSSGVLVNGIAGITGTSGAQAFVTEILKPNGIRTVFGYAANGLSGMLLGNVVSSLGYEIYFNYPWVPDPIWGVRFTSTIPNSVTAWNQFAGSGQQASISASSSSISITNAVGTFNYGLGCGALSSTPAAGGTTYNFDGSCRVSSVVSGAGTWNYGYVDSGGIRTVTITDPLYHTNISTVDIAKGLTLSETNGLGKTTSYTYDTYGRLTRTTNPEGDYVQRDYDTRGNVYQTTHMAKGGGSSIVTSASFDSSCTYIAKCNQPNSTTDARGYTTDIVYDTTTGLVTKVTAPVPYYGPYSAVRPETRITYQGLSASTGNPAVYRPTEISTCATGTAPSCAGTVDEIKTTATYGSVDTANAMYPHSISIGAGNATSGQISTSTVTYTPLGDVASVDGPLSGSDDTTRYYYNTARLPLAVVAADPDGSGSRKNPVTRNNYDSQARLYLVEMGTVTSGTASAWDSSFVLLGKQETSFDSASRTSLEKVTGEGSLIRSITQYSYDSANRLQCTAQRMIPSSYSSLPSSACTQASRSGSDPYDRISEKHYDAANQLTSVDAGVGVTGLAQTAVTYTYSDNGQQLSLADARSNVTSYQYDSFDRLFRTCYNANPCSSSVSDYEEYGYDAASNMTAVRTRAGGSSLTAIYDHLNRIVQNGEGATFNYDSLGRSLSVTKSSQTISTTWGPLDQKLTEVSAWGTVSYDYDLVGRRTKMTWPGSSPLVIAYDWYLDQLKAIREDGVTTGAGVLAAYTYDDFGRRLSISRAGGGGVTTGYAYEDDSTLKALGHTISGSSNSFSLIRNRAGQILSRTMPTAFAAPSPSVGSESWTANGLNQVTTTSVPGMTYDNRGNLASSVSGAYGYDTANRLTSFTSGSTVSLAYDATGRLSSIAGATTSQFAYDGLEVIADYNGGGTLQNLYVHGPNDDEIVAYYQGSKTGTKRWLLTDELNSIVAEVDGSGASMAINSYDEFGKPSSGNVGRFQYTGQMWLPEVGLYNYKARAYAPSLGRFLQSDPLEYADGPNLYLYVGNDPINFRDPSGLTAEDCTKDFFDLSKEPCKINEVAPAIVHGRRRCVICQNPIPGLDQLRDRAIFGLYGALANIAKTDCFVSEGEFSLGLQAGVSGRLGPLAAGGKTDLGSLRAKASSVSGVTARVTQSFGGSASLAAGRTPASAPKFTPNTSPRSGTSWKDTGAQMSIGGTVERDLWNGDSGFTPHSTFQNKPTPAFVGLGGSFALGVGVSGKIGLQQRGADGKC